MSKKNKEKKNSSNKPKTVETIEKISVKEVKPIVKEEKKNKEIEIKEEKVVIKKEEVTKVTIKDEPKGNKINKNLMGLFGIISIIFIVLMLMSWVIKTSSVQSGSFEAGDYYSLGIFQIFKLVYQSGYNFLFMALFILAVGGLYGVINKTNTYKSFIVNIAKKFNKNETLFTIITMSLMAIFVSVFGLQTQLFIIIPLVVSILTEMRYSKNNIALILLSSIAAGIMGSTISYLNIGYISTVFGVKIAANIIVKIALLFVTLFLSMLFVIKNTKKIDKSNYSENDPLLINNTIDKKQSNLPMAVILIFVVLYSLVASIPFAKEPFNLTLFTDIHKAVTEFSIFKVDFFRVLLGIDNETNTGLVEIGKYWYLDLTIISVLASLLLGFIYSIKFSDIVESFVNGAKKVVGVAFLVIFVQSILFITVTSEFHVTILKSILDITKDFNILTTFIGGIFESFLTTDIYYFAQISAPVFNTIVSDTKSSDIMTIIFQVTSGLASLVLPTSLILITVLSYLKVSYKDFIKKNYVLFIQLLISVLVIILAFNIIK